MVLLADAGGRAARHDAYLRQLARNRHGPLPPPRPVPLLLLALGAALLVATDPAAAETARRLTIDLESGVTAPSSKGPSKAAASCCSS